MSTEVFTGRRTLRPGKCSACGYDDDWHCDGRGGVLCECQRCAFCEELEGHAPGCSALDNAEVSCQDECGYPNKRDT